MRNNESAPSGESNHEMATEVPKSYAARFTELVGLTDAFCDAHLNAEYKDLCRRMAVEVCQEGSPVLKGKTEGWAAGIVYALGRVNFLEGRVASCGADRVRLTVRGRVLELPSPESAGYPPAGGYPTAGRSPSGGWLRPGEAATAVVRPETIRVAPLLPGADPLFTGTIRRVVYLGATAEYEIDWEGTTLLAVIGSPLEQGVLAEGTRVGWDFPTATTHLLPAEPTA